MMSVEIPGRLIFLQTVPKLDQQGTQVLKDGQPLSRVTLVELKTGSTLVVTVPTHRVAPVEPLTQVEVSELRVGVFKDRMYFHADGVSRVQHRAVPTKGEGDQR